MAVKINVAGAITGPNHVFANNVLTDGRSLHPLQRLGLVSHSGYPNIGAAGRPFGAAPPAKGPVQDRLSILTPSSGLQLNPALRVS